MGKKGETVSVKRKIQILEEYINEGNILKAGAIYKGYPVNEWARVLRHCANKVDNKYKIKLTNEQIEILDKLNVLNRQIDSTIDEKIESLIQWKKRYPKIMINKPFWEKTLREYYAQSDEEYKKLKEEFLKIRKYYYYARDRRTRGKLTEEQINILRENNISNIIGYSKSIIDLAQKYKITEKKINYIYTKFDTISNFIDLYINGKLEEKDVKLARKFVRPAINIDWNSPDGTIYDELAYVIYGNTLYSSENLKKRIAQLTDIKRYIIEKRFGLIDGSGKACTSSSIGRTLGLTREGIRQKIIRALREIKNDDRFVCFYKYPIRDNMLLTGEEKVLFEKLQKNISESNIALKGYSGVISDNETITTEIINAFKMIINIEERSKIENLEGKKTRKYNKKEKPVSIYF